MWLLAYLCTFPKTNDYFLHTLRNLKFISMSKNIGLIALCFFISLFTIPVLHADEIVYIDNLRTAKAMAAQEGKLILIDFTAKWCTNCKMLEEYTLTNPDVVDYIKGHYLPVKVNVDDFDGMDLKNQYQVGNLPTLMVLDSKGVLLDRHVGNMVASKMLEYLELNYKNRKAAQTHRTAPSSPNAGYVSKPNMAAAQKRKESYSVSTPVVSPGAKYGKTHGQASAPGYASAPQKEQRAYAPNANNSTVDNSVHRYNTPSSYKKPVRPEANRAAPLVAPAAPKKSRAAVGSKYEMGEVSGTVASMPSQGYTLQVGSFATEKALKLYSTKIKGVSNKQLKALKTKNDNGDSIYKLWVGHFDTYEQASAFKKSLAKKGITGGFVKRFS
jgi:thioredoxin-related protein